MDCSIDWKVYEEKKGAVFLPALKHGVSTPKNLMKVCLLTHTYPRFPNDTTAPFVESTAETLQEHGIDVTVLTPDTPKFARTAADHTVNLQTYRYFFPRRFQLLGYSNTLVNDCKLKRYVYLLAPFMFLSGIFHLFRLHRKHHFDVIHAQWLLPNGFIGTALCKVYKLPLVITMQGSDMLVAKKNPFFKRMAKWTLKHTAMVTSVTPTFLTELAALGVPDNQRCLIPNGVDPKMFHSTGRKEQDMTRLQEQLSIPEGDAVVFALGRIVLKKGFDILIQALCIVTQKYPNVTFIIGGDGTDLQRLKALAEDLSVSDSVRLPGTINRTDVPAYFHLCHDMNCGFKAYRAEVVKELYLYGDLHRYIPILAHQEGYKVGEVKVRHHPRRFGVSKYGFKRIPKGFFDLFTVLFLTKYLKRPLHVFGTIGVIVAFIGALIGLYLAVLWGMEGGVGFRTPDTPIKTTLRQNLTNSLFYAILLKV